MDERGMAQFIRETFDGLDILEASGDCFFYYDPDRRLPHDRRLPFATIVTSDKYDHVSDLNRSGIFRLNMGVSKQTFRSLFPSDENEPYDYAALDCVLPHPVYGSMYWVCVLNPGPKTFKTVESLLAEAHSLAASKYARRHASGE